MDEKKEKLDRSLLKYLEEEHEISNELHPYRETLAKLEALRDVPERDPSIETVARSAFLEQARSLSIPVSEIPNRRLKGWNTIFRKERSPMSTILGVLLALAVAFGGAGTTAYAAQDSLPNEPLYPVKQFTEEVRMALTTDTEAEVDLLLDLTQERVGEMVALTNQGLEVPEETQLRLQEHLQLAFANAAQLGDAALEGALQRIQNMAQNQIQVMQQARQNTPEGASGEALQYAITAMNRVRQDAEDGLEDPLTFRQRHGSNRPENAPEQPENVPPGKRNDAGSQSGEGTNGQGYGDGTGEGGGAYGDGYGDGSGEGGGAYGDGYGDGSGDDGGAYGDGDGDGVCDCTCDDPECDCATECMPQGPHNGKMDHKDGKH
jgi:hypothetical protein